MGLELHDDSAPSSWASAQIEALEHAARMLEPLSLKGLIGGESREAVAACNASLLEAQASIHRATRAIVVASVKLAADHKRHDYRQAEENVVLRARVLAGFLRRSGYVPPGDVLADLRNAVDALRALEQDPSCFALRAAADGGSTPEPPHRG